MTDAPTIAGNPLSDFLLDGPMARLRGVTERTQRAERLRGDGPPYVKDGRKIYYYVPGYREWLKARLTRPVRGPMAA
jgi:hypothetical protein